MSKQQIKSWQNLLDIIAFTKKIEVVGVTEDIVYFTTGKIQEFKKTLENVDFLKKKVWYATPEQPKFPSSKPEHHERINSEKAKTQDNKKEHILYSKYQKPVYGTLHKISTNIEYDDSPLQLLASLFDHDFLKHLDCDLFSRFNCINYKDELTASLPFLNNDPKDIKNNMVTLETLQSAISSVHQVLKILNNEAPKINEAPSYLPDAETFGKKLININYNKEIPVVTLHYGLLKQLAQTEGTPIIPIFDETDDGSIIYSMNTNYFMSYLQKTFNGNVLFIQNKFYMIPIIFEKDDSSEHHEDNCKSYSFINEEQGYHYVIKTQPGKVVIGKPLASLGSTKISEYNCKGSTPLYIDISNKTIPAYTTWEQQLAKLVFDYLGDCKGYFPEIENVHYKHWILANNSLEHYLANEYNALPLGHNGFDGSSTAAIEATEVIGALPLISD